MAHSIFTLALKAQLCVISDSLAQPGLQLLQALVQFHSNCLSSSASAPASQPEAALLCLQNPPFTASSSKLQVYDAFHTFPRSNTGAAHLSDPRNISLKLEKHTKILFIDSLSEFAARTSVREALLLVRTLQDKFPELHIVCMVSTDLDAEPSLSEALTTLPLSRSVARLAIHPSSLLHALKAIYNLNPESPALHSFLYRFQTRGWGGHGYRSEEADELEACSATDTLGSGDKAVLQWELRGHDLIRLLGDTIQLGGDIKSHAPTKSGEAPTKAESIKRGLLALVPSDTDMLEIAPLERVTADFLNVTKSAGLQSQQDPSVESISATLPFNLNLTSAQRAEKDSTVLPFHREAGDAGAEAIIHYEADSADDIDEEEGDED